MRILFVTSELVPYIKAGGLADVSAALPKALANKGHDLRIIIPKYSLIDIKQFKLEQIPLQYEVPNFDIKAEIEKTIYPNTKIIVYFVKCDYFYNRDEIYGNYEDNAERAIFFSKAVLELLKYIDWIPQIIHCNDWQTALIPALLKNLYNVKDPYQNIRTIFTIHNLAYQGIFPPEKFAKTGLDPRLFAENGLEFWGKLNLMKAGILFADILNTVSPTYALEIQTEEFGYGLESFLSKRKKKLFGILNGIDYELWDPQTDSFIWYQYDRNSLDRKYLNKIELQRECNLPQKDVPLIGMISRLVEQKGLDLIEAIFDEFMKLNLQFILLGTGLEKYHKFFSKMAKKYPKKTAIFLKFDNELAHKIEAGADFFLMPSKYEPCGLNQLISLRYGTIPIVRFTGGLADSITDIRTSPEGKGVGFVFQNYEPQELFQIVKEALNFYKDKRQRIEVMKRAMQKDFSWQVSAEKYEQLYQMVIKKS